MSTELGYRLWLGGIPQLNDKHKRALCAYFKSAEAVYMHATRNDILHALTGIRKKTEPICDLIIEAKTKMHPDTWLERMEELDITAYMEEDDGYPQYLRDLQSDAPFLLFAYGDYTPDQEKMLAVVGTRRSSRYGAEVAQKISKELAEAGVCVVSGMADGIDSYAHRGAIEGGGLTMAVLGCGVDVIYPQANKNLYDEIQKHGAVLSEYFPGTKPLPHHFPARNRIISGMCPGVLLVECPERSGAMITARLCMEQGRELFVIPGNITSPQASGSNGLLLCGGSPVLNVEDILNRFEWLPTFSVLAGDRGPEQELSELDKRVCEKLHDGELHLEELATSLSENTGVLMSHLTLMEIRGIIKQLPGQLFALIRR